MSKKTAQERREATLVFFFLLHELFNVFLSCVIWEGLGEGKGGTITTYG
jgi:hypothetical protein